MHIFSKTLPIQLFSIYKKVNLLRTMSVASSEFLINDPKYSFLKDLGLAEKNLGVFDGNWKASGKVKVRDI